MAVSGGFGWFADEQQDSSEDPHSMSTMQQLHQLYQLNWQDNNQGDIHILVHQHNPFEHENEVTEAEQLQPDLNVLGCVPGQTSEGQLELTRLRARHVGTAESYDGDEDDEEVVELEDDNPILQEEEANVSRHRVKSASRKQQKVAKPKSSSGSESPQPTNRELHNEIERRRRLRIKQCCDILRTLVPGLNDKTDKATVLEHTVKFVNHLVECPNSRCECEY